MTQDTQSQNAESKAVARSMINDDWLAAKVRREGATLATLVESYAQDFGINVWDDEGDGVYTVELIKDKDFLRGLPFLITRWKFNTSDKFKDDEGNDGVFVSVEIAYKTAPDSPMKTGVFNDGSTGVCAQLRAITAARMASGKGDPYAGRGVRHGLRVSVYQRDTGKTNPKTGEAITEEATTYYLDL